MRRHRERIERAASELAKAQRHDFRQMTRQLREFADDLDRFEAYEGGGETQGCEGHSARVSYIRGIAAHCLGQPDIAEKCLERVTACDQPEPGEDEKAYSRRRANACRRTQ